MQNLVATLLTVPRLKAESAISKNLPFLVPDLPDCLYTDILLHLFLFFLTYSLVLQVFN